MKLYYDPWQEIWFQDGNNGKINFGKNRMRVPDIQGSGKYCFEMLNLEGNAGPLIGIMTSITSKGIVKGNRSLFKKLQSEALSKGGMTIVFPPEGLNGNQISGHTYLNDKSEWIPIVTPLPHVVYNRVPLRKTEESLAYSQASSLFQEWNIPFFNPSFINKYELYKFVSSHPMLAPLMPETILVNDMESLKDFFDRNKNIYLKPVLSSQGDGLYTLRLVKDNILELSSHTVKLEYSSFEDFWTAKSQKILDRHYIAQAEIIPALLDGSRFDFRIHAHDSPEGYKVTGVGIRLSKKQSLTTHVPNGGIVIPYERVRTKEHDKFFAWLVKEVGFLISRELGYFGEFSIDAGITERGNYVLYEVNSKPMSFDEEDIEQRKTSKIMELLFLKAGF
ncbi:YheC/YheD family endospore coat-associated protein [Mesobacillus foraminis]|uniref:YheC/YheD family endospore coat-associated protein n=1 Tax=Mesobacillus foraminis TaxID=279826 RepID=UPI000EF45A14|nr:YheC/YheD family protein [Mesobacillus foraminis]